ncbi:hypothetical protein N7488_012447 [Penicillium malachiteum]|nr:hypothetical protein N7488_012447 [Penicillium malachiteum]
MMEFRDDVKDIRSRWVVRSAIAPSTLWTQTWTAICRHYQLIWGDKRTFITLVIFNILNAVINGSSYYMAPKDVTGSYEKSSALFLFSDLNALTEATSTVRSRSILLKQVQYGLIHPSAFITAQTLAEIPISFSQSLLFACLYYWQIDLQQTASAFWIFVLIVFTYYLAVQSLFRALGAWSPNISLTLMMAGSAIPVGLLYSEFGPTRSTQHKWGSWLRRASPSPWALEALMGNEFTGITLTCSDSDMVPSGPGYNDSAYQRCSITGSGIGEKSVARSVYLQDHFGFTRAHLWRNFGIILISWFLYTVIGSIGLTVMTRDSSNSMSRVFKRSKKRDIESQPKSPASSATDAMPGTNSTTADGEPTNSTTSIQGLQKSMIAVLLLSWINPATCAGLQDMWFRKWDLFTAREKNGIYDWKALVTALIAVELPWQLGTYSLIFLSTYWTVGFPNIPAIAGFNYFTWLLLAIFGTGYSQLLAAMFPTPLMGGYANSLFWVILMVFSGVLKPHSYMDVFYRVWLFWADPM